MLLSLQGELLHSALLLGTSNSGKEKIQWAEAVKVTGQSGCRFHVVDPKSCWRDLVDTDAEVSCSLGKQYYNKSRFSAQTARQLPPTDRFYECSISIPILLSSEYSRLSIFKISCPVMGSYSDLKFYWMPDASVSLTLLRNHPWLVLLWTPQHSSL